MTTLHTFELLKRLGLFVRPGWLDRPTCERLSAEMRAGQQDYASVVTQSEDDKIDQAVRRTMSSKMSKKSVEFAQSALDTLIPSIQDHFRISLKNAQPPQFLIYRTGDFFRPHSDNNPTTQDFCRARRISVVQFLNSGETSADNPSYRGGALMLYGLFDNPRGQNVGIPLHGETGLVVAFPAHVSHEVTPVTEGERYTVVSWYE